MTHPLPRLAALAAAAALTCAAPLAAAATNTSSVLITSFAASGSSGTLSFTDPYQTFAAAAQNAGGLLGAKTDSFATEDYGIAIVGATTSNASAAGSTTTPQTFWATAGATSSVGALTNLPNRAESIILQSGSFTLSSAGTVTFLIGYQLGVAAPGGNAVSDYGSALLAFNLADNDGSADLSDSLMSFTQASGQAARSGSFTLSVNLAAGETGFYNLQGSALAFATAAVPVPEPQSWLLLAAGLAGMAAWTRQRSQRHDA